jgi:hypothetical protein
MWIAIHMGRNREHIGSKETVKSPYSEEKGSQGWQLAANSGGSLPIHHNPLNF